MFIYTMINCAISILMTVVFVTYVGMCGSSELYSCLRRLGMRGLCGQDEHYDGHFSTHIEC